MKQVVKKKALFTFLGLIFVTSMMACVFLVTLNVVKAQSSDSNGNPSAWPMYQSDLSHTGYSTSTGPTTNQLKWSWNTGATISGGTSPAVANGIVYVSSTQALYALNASTGTNIYTYTTPGGGAFSSPAVANGIVYVG